MTQDEIIEMARQAGFERVIQVNPHTGIETIETYAPDSLERFAKLVAAKEREACADMVFRYISQTDNMEARGCLASVAHDIRARGEA